MRKLVVFALVWSLCGLSASVQAGLAAESTDPWTPSLGPCGQSGASNKAHLAMYAKDQTTWQIISDGPFGKFTYNRSGDTLKFVFNGHELVPYQDYSLIYYPDPWPGSGLIVLGTATAGALGDVHIKGSVNTGSLPIPTDLNAGAKIWLVLSGDVGTSPPQMVNWHGAGYLFEECFITFTSTAP